MAGQDEGGWAQAVTRVEATAVGSVAPPGSGAPPKVPRAAAPSPASPRPRNSRRPAIVGAAIAGVVAVLVVVLLSSGGDQASAAQAMARAINLRASDLPGFVISLPSHGGDTGSQLDARMKQCVGPGLATQLNHSNVADVSSPTFTSGSGLQGEEVSSSVTIVHSPAVIHRDVEAINSRRIQGCLASVFDGGAVPTSAGATVTINNVRVASIPAPLKASNSFRLRITMTMNVLNVSLPVVLDILGYGVGTDELGLMTFAIERPFPQPAERQLSSLLIARALTHPH